jgi:type IV secretion system protein VirB8
MNSDHRDYYVQAASWAEDVNGALRASRRRAFYVAGAAATIAVLEAVALVVLMPLKTVVPYTITVDRQTGAVALAQGVQPGALSQNMAVVQSFLAQYVLARETFDVTDLQHNYQQVAAWTRGPARDQYLRAMQKTNPQAPENVYAASTALRIIVRSISLLSKNSALVRFDAERTDGGGAPSAPMPFTAVIGFEFSGAPMRMEDRLLNPLGFQVTSYRRDAEAAAQPVAP